MVIQLLDVNDNAPRFVLSSYNKVIHENTTVDTSILRVTATDADSGTNAKIQYVIREGNVNESFHLDQNGVLKLRHKLIGQSVKLFNLTVVAKDSGRPPLSSKPTTIYVRVRRRFTPTVTPNEESTSFPVPIYLATINESCPVKTEILRVRAKSDKPEYKGVVSYFLFEVHDPEVNQHFEVNEVTGSIKLIFPLDFERRSRYAYFVGAVGEYQLSCISNYCSFVCYIVCLLSTLFCLSFFLPT